MPDIDYLMQEWPAEFEEVLAGTHLPTADLDCDLATYVEIICSECACFFPSYFVIVVLVPLFSQTAC